MSVPDANNPSRPHRSLTITVLCATLVAAAGAGAWWALTPKEQPPATSGAEPAPPVVVSPWFRDVTAGCGLDFTYRNGKEANQHAILETLGGGVALLDFDGDGLLDVLVVGGGEFAGPDKKRLTGFPCEVYRNRGDFHFEDVTATVGLGGVNWWYTHGVAVADYDRDGWPDFLVTGYGRITLFHNEPDRAGGRRFADVTAKMGLSDDSWCTSAGWADLDGDGFPDVYVCHYCDWSVENNPPCPGRSPSAAHDICTPQQFKPLAHALFRNTKGTGFARWGDGLPATPGYGLGVVLADLDGDSRPDIYVANDTTTNFLLMNRGGRFDETALTAGVAADEVGKPDGSMGVDVGDYEGTGRPSIWVTNFQNQFHALYRNQGGGAFLHQSRATGVAALGQQYVGFGTGFLDADNDGWEDLVFANGHVYASLPEAEEKQRPVLLRNAERNGRRYFEDVSRRGGPYFASRTLGRGMAVGDLNNDGRPDLVFTPTNAPVAVLQNVAGETAPAKWVGLKLVGRAYRDVVGSTVVVESDGRKLTRFAKGGGSYLSASDPRLLFGLGSKDTPVRVTVRWSWGGEQVWEGVTPGRYWELREGEADAK